jgi:hypothetical protein
MASAVIMSMSSDMSVECGTMQDYVAWLTWLAIGSTLVFLLPVIFLIITMVGLDNLE